jgi:hypothetical protein
MNERTRHYTAWETCIEARRFAVHCMLCRQRAQPEPLRPLASADKALGIQGGRHFGSPQMLFEWAIKSNLSVSRSQFVF